MTQPSLSPGAVVDPRLSAWRATAVALRVDSDDGTAQATVLPSSSADGRLEIDLARGASASLLGHDAIEVHVANVDRSKVGAYQAGRVRVTMKVRVVNTLSSVSLIEATWPAPPVGTSGIVLIPLDAYAVAGKKTVVGAAGDANMDEVIVSGTVRPSTDWNEGPADFFSPGDGCTAGETLCTRFVSFAAPLAPRASTPWRRIGFDVDPTVKSFRARLLLSADLAPR
jgi:hypothetical protein